MAHMVIAGVVTEVKAQEECAECFGKVDADDMCDCTRAAAEAAALAEIHAEIDAMYAFENWAADVDAAADRYDMDEIPF